MATFASVSLCTISKGTVAALLPHRDRHFVTEFTTFDTRWILICAALAMTMQIGFCMLESGMVRQKNSINVAFKNLMDFIVAGLAYWAVGFGIMYGLGESNGIYGTTMFLKGHADGAVALIGLPHY